jgi:hypothetical protein
MSSPYVPPPRIRIPPLHKNINAESDDEEVAPPLQTKKKRPFRSPIVLRARRQQLEETTVLGSKRARAMQNAGYSALQKLEAARYAQLNRGPDPHLERVIGRMNVPTRVPPGVNRLPFIPTTVTEEVSMGGNALHRELLKTIVKHVDSK